MVDVLVIMDRSGLGPASQDHALQALRAVYRMAAADDPWLANPAAVVPAPRRVLTPKVVPTRGQVLAMLAGAPDPRTKALVAILAYTGMRIGERWTRVITFARQDDSGVTMRLSGSDLLAWSHTIRGHKHDPEVNRQ